MSASPAVEWRRRWGELRARRITAALSLPAAVLAGTVLGGWTGWLLAATLPIVALVRVYAWRCPECRLRFTGASVAPMPLACYNCGVAAFDLPPDETHGRTALHDGGRTLTRRLRRLVAVSQGVGGILVGVVTFASAWQGVPLVWWYALMLQGIALTAVLSAVLLWRDHPEGARLTRILLLLQVVKVYSPWIVYDLRAGFGVLLHASAATQGVMLDASGILRLGYGMGVEPAVAVNVLALVWLCVLLGNRHRPIAATRSIEAETSAGRADGRPA